MKDSFVLYTGYMEHIGLMDMEQRGVLLTALMMYVSGNELPDMDGITQMAFSFIKSQIDRDAEKYEEICRKRSEAGKTGGRPKANGFSGKQEKAKKANGFSEKQTKAKKADNDTEYDTDTDSDIKDNMSSRTSSDRPVYPYRDIVDYLNQQAGTAFRASSADTQKHIRARFVEGYSLEDFKRVIDNKVREWGKIPAAGEKDMRKYLRPATLFGTKFESYLQEKPLREKRTRDNNNFQRREYDMDALESRLLGK